jgi:hypothetical protein
MIPAPREWPRPAGFRCPRFHPHHCEHGRFAAEPPSRSQHRRRQRSRCATTRDSCAWPRRQSCCRHGRWPREHVEHVAHVVQVGQRRAPKAHRAPPSRAVGQARQGRRRARRTATNTTTTTTTNTTNTSPPTTKRTGNACARRHGLCPWATRGCRNQSHSPSLPMTWAPRRCCG